MTDHEATSTLRQSILARIRAEECRCAKRHIILSGTIIPAALFVGALTARYAAQTLTDSDFYNLLSLIVSDTDVIALYWREFSLSLAESAPLLFATLALGTIFIALASLRTLIGDIENLRLRRLSRQISSN